ncbi:hypothetical protein [Myroides sp. DW712]|uniref:hypothetical protein n=1 Tax=Myroides sp. DW712 TaxID=3389800 RepID=UPI00397AF049
MKKKICILLCSLTFFSAFNLVHAQLPYTNTAFSIDEFGLFLSSGEVKFQGKGAELTTKANETNGIFLSDLVLVSERGFILGFDYLMTGSGGSMVDKGANGLALVVFDATEVNPTIGSKTSGLGYSYSQSYSSKFSVLGLSKGFLSVGFDLYGDSKERLTLDHEFRNGIYTQGRQQNHVTVRGQGNRLEGYPVYLSQSVTNINERYKLNIETGEYLTAFEAPDPKGFSFKLRENNANNEVDSNAGFGHPSYRRVVVSLLPSSKLRENGFYLNVDITHGSETSRVVNSLFIPSKGNITYKEVRSTTGDVLKTYRINCPTQFKIGFTATTGAIYQKHIVRNIYLSLPFAPLVKDVRVSAACKDHTTTFDALINSVGFDTNKYVSGQQMESLGGKEHLDLYSFQFLTQIDNKQINTLEPYVATTAAGRYEYNPKTGEVVFTPVKGMLATSDKVYFSIKNKKKVVGTTNLGGEQYRSEIAAIELDFTLNCNDVLMVNGGAF